VSRPKNILYIIDSLTYGGTEKQLLQLIHNLDPQKYRAHLCILKNPEDLYQQLEIPKLCLHFKSFAHPSIIRVYRELAKYIRQNQVDIVQTFFQDPFLLGAIVKPFRRIRLIGSFRDLGFWKTSAESRKMRLAYPFFDLFIANSEAVKQHFVQNDGLPTEKIDVIYNGIYDSIFTDIDPAEKFSQQQVVGIVANLNRPVKRVQDFVSAAAVVHKQRPGVQFVVIGDGHLRADLEAQVTDLGLVDVFRFTGRMSDPLDEIRAFHVGVITSESEGFCSAILEYMACGVPVVATDTGGNPEMVTDGENGILVPVANPEELGKGILRLLEDRILSRVVAEVNYRKVRAGYRTHTMIERHQASYALAG